MPVRPVLRHGRPVTGNHHQLNRLPTGSAYSAAEDSASDDASIGGGGLENAAPVRTPLSAKVYRGHHYCNVMVNGNTLRMEAYDIDNRLFDFVELNK
jgi:hypothetical protein